MSVCPCGAGEYEACCGPRHSGARPAETAEALMRSRYAAFAKGEVEYLRATQTRPTDDAWVKETRRWTTSVTWLSLELVDRVKGGADDATGEVEFIARYLEGDAVTALRERSRFERRDGRWIYDAGEPTVTTTKVERNTACPCGSGKKFKACHA